MKKNFLTLFAAVAMISLISSCNKDPQNNPDGKDDTNPDDTPTALITIDGDFADWAKADNVVSTKVSEESTYLNLLTMKAVADEMNVYLYFEYKIADGQTVAPIDILVNSDNDTSTGFSSWIWANVGWDYMLESEAGFLDGSAIKAMDDMKVYKCNGPDGVDAWDASSNGMTDLALVNISANAGTVSAGIAYFELSFLRAAINAEESGKITLGVTATNVIDGAWETAGILPESGSENMLEITLP